MYRRRLEANMARGNAVAWIVGLSVASVLAFTTAPASAAPVAGTYVAVDVGANDALDTTYELAGALTPAHPTSFSTGYAGSLRLGRGWSGPRAEVELAYRTNDVANFGPSGNSLPGSGNIDSTTVMLNGYYDIDMGNRFTPFVGAGIGAAWVKADMIQRDIPPSTCCSGFVDGQNTVFAWQVMAGVAVQLSSHLDLTFEYRYLQTANVRYNYGVGCFADGTGCLATGALNDEYKAQSLSVGLRWGF